MSNLVFPKLPGLKWSVFRTPEFNNDIKTTDSGRTFARAKWITPKWNYKLEYEFLMADASQELQQLAGFFMKHYGNADTWLFDDEDDNTATNQQFGVGNGTASQFQLLREMGGFYEPVYELNGAPTIYYNGNPAGTNLLIGGSFETNRGDGCAAWWEPYWNGETGSATYSISSGGVFGSKVQRIEASGLGTTSIDRLGVTQIVNVTTKAGKQATFSAFVCKVGASFKVRAYMDVYDSEFQPVLGASGTPVDLPDVYTQITLNVTLPSNAHYAYLYIWADSRSGGSGPIVLLIDGAQFVEGTVPTDFIASEYKYTIDSHGLVTFSLSPPGNGVSLTWSGQYYWRCRFKKSTLELENFLKQLWSAKSVEFRTERP